MNGTSGSIASNSNSDAEDIAAGSAVNANLVVGTGVKTISSDIRNLGQGIVFQKTPTDAAFREIDASKSHGTLRLFKKKGNQHSACSGWLSVCSSGK